MFFLFLDHARGRAAPTLPRACMASLYDLLYDSDDLLLTPSPPAAQRRVSSPLATGESDEEAADEELVDAEAVDEEAAVAEAVEEELEADDEASVHDEASEEADVEPETAACKELLMLRAEAAACDWTSDEGVRRLRDGIKICVCPPEACRFSCYAMEDSNSNSNSAP